MPAKKRAPVKSVLSRLSGRRTTRPPKGSNAEYAALTGQTPKRAREDQVPKRGRPLGRGLEALLRDQESRPLDPRDLSERDLHREIEREAERLAGHTQPDGPMPGPDISQVEALLRAQVAQLRADVLEARADNRRLLDRIMSLTAPGVRYAATAGPGGYSSVGSAALGATAARQEALDHGATEAPPPRPQGRQARVPPPGLARPQGSFRPRAPMVAPADAVGPEVAPPPLVEQAFIGSHRDVVTGTEADPGASDLPFDSDVVAPVKP